MHARTATPGDAAAIAEIQPSAAAGRHTHPGEEIGYVLNGPVVIEIDGKPAIALSSSFGFGGHNVALAFGRY